MRVTFSDGKNWVRTHYLDPPPKMSAGEYVRQITQFYACRLDAPVTSVYRGRHSSRVTCDLCDADGMHRETIDPLPDIFSM